MKRKPGGTDLERVKNFNYLGKECGDTRKNSYVNEMVENSKIVLS